ncbi:NAD(P)-binding domain-containing protein [Flavobacterium ginsengiterrae]|uniref:Pyrroline-5-carboxylate reductase catalytic N-terminal domain-containing protein n=1 Tax=Flavobacterium ginsengiterrae TaxID=871695 RepID=A0ABP7H4L1_9FLAO
MRVGIIGIGSLTMELAFRSAKEGYTVIVSNPKGNSLIMDAIEKMGPNVWPGTLEQAVCTDIIFLFIPKEDLQKVLGSLPDVSGKIIVHTSGLIFNPQTLLSGLTNAMTYKITASLLPKAQVVKLFNPVNLKSTKDSREPAAKEEIFFIADHKASRENIKKFLKTLHFSPIDLSGKLHLQNKPINFKAVLNPPYRHPEN